MNNMNMSLVTRLLSFKFLVAGIFALATLSIGMVVYSQWLSSRSFEENTSLISVAQTIQQEVATAHLWFEEALGGDTTIDLEADVHARLDTALQLTEIGNTGALPATRQGLLDLQANISLFDQLVDSRWTGRNSTGVIGGKEDQAFDAVFADVLLQSRTIVDDVSDFIAADQRKIFAINMGMLIVLAALFSTMAALVSWNRRAMDARAASLENLVEERTAKLVEREAEALQKNRALALARDHARAASKVKSQFLANMSHEIRTPMNGVIGMTSLLQRTDLTQAQKEYVDTLHSSGLSLLSIVNDILDYSEIEATKISLNITNFSVKAALDEVFHLFSVEAAKKELVLSSVVDSEVPGRLRGDHFRLVQIFSNLVSNAIKFSNNGEISLSCSLGDHHSDDGETLELLFEVSDPGVGISKQNLDKLFERFSQVDESSTRPHGGSGLGLAISRQLAMLMGGRMGVRSQLGEGSTFWFTAHFGAAEPAGLEGVVAEDDKQQPMVAGLRFDSGQKVLVVDDSDVNRLVAQRMLEELGFEVDLATNGAEAVDAAAANANYAAILIDSQMPVMDGNEATRIIRSAEGKRRRTPIIALTANAMELGREKAFAADVDDYLCKPVFLEDLEVVLDCQLSGNGGAAAEGVAANTGSTRAFTDSVFNMSIVEELVKIPGSRPGDLGLFSELASKMMDHMPVWLDEIESAASAGDVQTLRRHAHKLLGMCRQLGAERMARACDELESTDEASQSSDMVRSVKLLHKEFASVEQALHQQDLL